MSKRIAVALAVAALIAAAGTGVAQPGPAAAKKADAEPGRYVVTPVGASAVMVDSATGKTWVFHADAHPLIGGGGAWLPAKKIDDPADAAAWLHQQAEFRRKFMDPAAKDGK